MNTYINSKHRQQNIRANALTYNKPSNASRVKIPLKNPAYSTYDEFSSDNSTQPHFRARLIMANKKNILIPSGNLEYYRKYYNVQPSKANMEKLKDLRITNFREIENNNCRGESLSAKRNSKFLSLAKQYGIETIIDLRTADHTDKFGERCKSYGLKYMHLPIDAKTTSTRQVIDQLPILFQKLENGNCYIACAQGLHRTDIALAMNYLFNPKHSPQPPRMYGHIKEGGMRTQDIFTRANSILKEITPEDKAKLNWTPEFEAGYTARKKELIRFNES